MDAARWLAASIFPRVLQRVPEARLELVGHEPGDEILALAGDRVSVHGSVPDVTPYMDRAAVVVAPIRIGGGMRVKVLEAMAAGKALVATRRAAEGVEAQPGEHLLVADDEDQIVEASRPALARPAPSPASRRGAPGAGPRRIWAGTRESPPSRSLYASLAQARRPCD